MSTQKVLLRPKCVCTQQNQFRVQTYCSCCYDPSPVITMSPQYHLTKLFANRPRLIYQYSNMTPRPLGQNCKNFLRAAGYFAVKPPSSLGALGENFDRRVITRMTLERQFRKANIDAIYLAARNKYDSFITVTALLQRSISPFKQELRAAGVLQKAFLVFFHIKNEEYTHT